MQPSVRLKCTFLGSFTQSLIPKVFRFPCPVFAAKRTPSITAPPDAAAPGVGSFCARMTTSELTAVSNPPRYVLRYGRSVAAPPRSFEPALEDFALLLEAPPTCQTDSGKHESRRSRSGTTAGTGCGTPTDNSRRGRPNCRHGPRGTSPMPHQ